MMADSLAVEEKENVSLPHWGLKFVKHLLIGWLLDVRMNDRFGEKGEKGEKDAGGSS